MPHYSDTITADGQINARAIMQCAVVKARHERAQAAKIGWDRSWNAVMAAALKEVWAVAKSMKLSRQRHAEVAALPPAEQQARGFEIKADLAESAIPPRDGEAKQFRAQAAAARYADMRSAA